MITMRGGHEAMQELENAARTFLAPANLVSSEQRHASEQVFLQLQKTKQPYDLCKLLLEESQVQYVQFQAATLLKNALIREWKELTAEQELTLRNYLLQYLTSRENMESFVREQMVLVLAIMTKRHFVDGHKEVITNMLNEISQLIMNDNQRHQVIGCSVLGALLNEFASSTRATDVGLIWEAHILAKKEFETLHLPKIFDFCLHVLIQVVNLETPIPPNVGYLVGKFLGLAEQILSWNFQFAMILPRKLVHLFETQVSPTLRPGKFWRDTLIKQEVPGLFFKLYEKFETDPALGHSAIQCVNQLCTLTGAIFATSEDQRAYIRWMMEGVLGIVARTPVRNHVVSVTTTISKLLMFQPSAMIKSQPVENLSTFLQRMTALTCHLIEMSAQEDASSVDDHVYEESLDIALATWMTFCHEPKFGDCSLEEPLLQVYTTHLRAHLSRPDGIKPDSTNSQEVTESEETDDRVVYKDQLTVIGLMGRRILGQTVPMVTQLLEARTASLQQLLQQNMSGSNLFVQVLEDIHWLILYAGNLLSTGVIRGENNLIQRSIIDFCRSQEANVNVDNTLRALSQPSQPITESNVDPIVRLVIAVFRLGEMEDRALEAGLACSPEVARSIVWFLRHWSPVYLLPDENLYSELSGVLLRCFGRESDAGKWVLDLIIGKLKNNLSRWSGEEVILKETCQCLTVLLNSMERGSKAIQCPCLVDLIQLACRGSFNYLPTEATRSLMKSLIIAGNMLKENEADYFDQLLKPLREAFDQLQTSDSFRRDFAQESVRRTVIGLLERLTGAIDGIHVTNIELMSQFVLPLLPQVVALLELYHNYQDMVTCCIQVFLSVASNMIGSLKKAECSIVYQCIFNILKCYAKNQSGRLTIDPSAEEAQYQDILDLITLLGEVLIKEVMGFLPDTPNESETTTGNELGVSDLAFHGLNFLMPLMTPELLRFPTLCSKYFNFVNIVGDMYREKMYDLSEGLLMSIFGTVRLGVTDFTPEVANVCLDFIAGFSMNILQSQGRAPPIVHQLTQPFLKLILEMSLLQPLESEMTAMAGSALFPLMCCYPNLYKELVESMVNSQGDQILKQRLAEAFSQLTESVQLVPDRQNRVKFRSSFETFTTRVRGFLCVK